MKLEYHDENFLLSEIEFPDEMVELANKLSNSLGEVSNDDHCSNILTYPELYSPIMVDNDKNSLRFGVNLAKNRHEREIGTNLYVVKISKYTIDNKII